MLTTPINIIGTVAGRIRIQCCAGFPECDRARSARASLKPDRTLAGFAGACVGVVPCIGLFYPFIDDKQVQDDRVEAGGLGLETGKHAAPLSAGHPGVLHGNRTYLMNDADGQILDTHSISAGLDYPGVGLNIPG